MKKEEFIKAYGPPYQGESDLAVKILGYIYDETMKFGGKKTVAEINAMTLIPKNTIVFPTDGGSVTAGTLTVAAKDIILWNGTVWIFLLDFA
ncbi:MAG: hypothetical protein RI909_1285 [Bacteroidota bacterium]